MSIKDGGPDDILLYSFCGDDALVFKDSLRADGLLPPREGKSAPKTLPVTYDYRDRDGRALFRMVRRPGKKFHAETPDGHGGWSSGMKGVAPILYRLPELLAADPATLVFSTEGERDSDALAARGLVAVTNPNGAGKWRAAYSAYLIGRECVILPDNDDAGRDHAAKVAASLAAAGVDHVILDLPGLPAKGDVSDWLAAGGTADELLTLAANAFRAPAPPALKPPVMLANDVDRAAICPAAEANENAVLVAFIDQFGSRFRYDRERARWHEWTGTYWRPEKRGRVVYLARCIAEATGERLDNPKTAAAMLKLSVAQHVEVALRSEPPFAITTDEWNCDPWLLATPGGTVDLRSGALRRAEPTDMINRCAGFAPMPSSATHWLQFLNETFGNDAALIRFVQQFGGYCLTGETREHAMVFGEGDGGNGKGTVERALRAVFGSYAGVAAMQTFVASKYERHLTELAMLDGLRLVSVSETEEAGAWNEGRLKQLTGGDAITANFMRQDHITFVPKFKLFITGNVAPTLVSPDPAMRRRLNLLPFNHTPKAIDLDLDHKLAAEGGQILFWLIAGCLDWQANGLIRPPSVLTATEAYFDDQSSREDAFDQWYRLCCSSTPDTDAYELTMTLKASWAAFASANRVERGSDIRLSRYLKSKGHKAGKTQVGGARAYSGIILSSRGNATDGGNRDGF